MLKANSEKHSKHSSKLIDFKNLDIGDLPAEENQKINSKIDPKKIENDSELD